jgi:hypothetical protein
MPIISMEKNKNNHRARGGHRERKFSSYSVISVTSVVNPIL